tara:strand:+ start:11180 stop:11794 length:615 start_codon:yes stop_codon:yes gene_type:complete
VGVEIRRIQTGFVTALTKIKNKILKKIVVIGASSSSRSINRKFAKYAANSLLLDCKIKELVLNDFEMPIYSEDLQRVSGVPVKAINFKRVISNSDGIIISFAEHNGSYTSAFKNIFDWISVIEQDIWSSKPLLLLSTSTGSNGGKIVLKHAYNRFSFNYKFNIPFFSLPNFHSNYNSKSGIIHPALYKEFLATLSNFEDILNGT